MLLDANLLIYAVDAESTLHSRARAWLEEALNGPRRVGLPWVSLVAFVRIVTNPRAVRDPLDGASAWQFVDDWLSAPAAWVPAPGPGYPDTLGRLVRELDLRGNLVSDAALAALAIEHGLSVVSADSDFARFPGLTWTNPLL
jgi:toxin-antitoxin system PIN domain toxin